MLALLGVGQEILRFLWALRTVISKLKKYVFVVWGKTFSLFLLKTKVTAGSGAVFPLRTPLTSPLVWAPGTELLLSQLEK